jgi:hypothetical protein
VNFKQNETSTIIFFDSYVVESINTASCMTNFSNHEFQPRALISCVSFDTGMGVKVEGCVDHLESAFWMSRFVAVI